ncbi:MBL fold metallo-hydrolase [Actinospica sp. MGRD01-02]|uniref:MBL fold metallo-hydrolase n=1 Tax=Actinospica acidithermotolerans TaxID=2828514 RepID=A0A941E9R6_9ACTN|nr:MBL fold metallo-hydrolase [Actinospica acidithermotolerans]MBR7827192.1 MBL fold metallo-hydrolase [Actinospica acidithermotolerans]
MLIAGFPAGSFGTNCYVIAPAAGERCVVVDPGQDAADGVAEILREHRLRPAAVVLTHGHLDHMWSVLPVCGAHDVPAYIHPADRFMLADPLRGVSPQFAALVGPDVTFAEPDEVRELADGAPLGLGGVLGFDLVVDHAPGHTKGSVTFTLPRLDDAGDPDVMFSGDLLFAGSIGRSDLPGGDPAELNDSLKRVVLPRPDDTLVLPGHGGSTTIGRERASNPFLRGLKSVDSARPGL